MQLAVVQTYPAHFYQTKLTLCSLRAHYPELDEIIVVADTWSPLVWSGYQDRCRDAYGGLATDIWYSKERFLDFGCLARWPYARQQTLKLYLDTKISPDIQDWLFVDGDVEFHGRMPEPGIVATLVRYQGQPLEQQDPGPGDTSSQIVFYIRHMLGLNWQYWPDPQGSGCILTVTHPPVKRMRRDLLIELREFLQKRHRINLINLHWRLARDTRMSISEWELLEAFRQEIMGEPRDWIPDQADFCSATWSSDRELGRDWFRERDIEVDPDIWTCLPLAKYL